MNVTNFMEQRSDLKCVLEFPMLKRPSVPIMGETVPLYLLV
jgi:hypothetical protein